MFMVISFPALCVNKFFPLSSSPHSWRLTEFKLRTFTNWLSIIAKLLSTIFTTLFFVHLLFEMISCSQGCSWLSSYLCLLSAGTTGPIRECTVTPSPLSQCQELCFFTSWDSKEKKTYYKFWTWELISDKTQWQDPRAQCQVAASEDFLRADRREGGADTRSSAWTPAELCCRSLSWAGSHWRARNQFVSRLQQGVRKSVQWRNWIKTH